MNILEIITPKDQRQSLPPYGNVALPSSPPGALRTPWGRSAQSL